MHSDAYRVWLYICFAGSFCNSLVFTVTAIFFVRNIGLNPFQLVFVGTVMEVAVFLFEVPTGAVADLRGRKLSVILSTMICGAGVILVGLSSSYPPVLLGYVLWGIGATFASGALEAWVTDEYEGPDLQRVFLRGGQVGAVGSLLGIVSSVALASIELAIPIVVGGILSILMGLSLAFKMPELRFRPAPRVKRSAVANLHNAMREGAGLVRRSRLLLIVLGIAAFFGMFTEGIDRLWEAHFLKNFGFPSLGSLDPIYWFGIIECTGLCLCWLAASVMARRPPTGQRSQITALSILDSILFLGMLGFALAGNFFLALVAYLVVTVSRSLDGPLFIAWLNQNISSERRATVLSIVNQSDAVGQWVGGPVIGALGTVFSLRVALSAGAFVILPAVGLYARLIARPHAPEIVEERSAVLETRDP